MPMYFHTVSVAVFVLQQQSRVSETAVTSPKGVPSGTLQERPANPDLVCKILTCIACHFMYVGVGPCLH